MMNASDLFRTYHAYKSVECNLEDILIDNFPWWVVDNYFFDPYDSSIEFKYVPEEWAPIPLQLKFLHDYGFQKLFVNYEDGEKANLYDLSSGHVEICTNNVGKGSILP